MQIARDNINPYVLAVEEAQSDIRELVKRAYMRRLSLYTVNRELEKIINKATKGVQIERLKNDIRRSLINFANAQRRAWQSLGITPALLLFLGSVQGKENPPLPPESIAHELPKYYQTTEKYYKTTAKGVPLQTYYKDVWEKQVRPIFNKLAKERALDPNDFSEKHNSLRNLAEMEVRYHDHIDSIESLKNSGARLVVCSAHEDCSERCAPWQGKVYSLDGTSGTTPEGYKYVPLERATDHYYTTKAGRTYKNGLLGFNCRHKLSEYKGELLPTVSERERKKEYAITRKQRELEKKVRNARAEMLINKDINRQKYLEARRNAIDFNKEYMQFSKDNNRAYYPMRTRIT